MNIYKFIGILIAIIAVAIAGYLAGRSENMGYNPLQKTVDSLIISGIAQEAAYNTVLDSVLADNRAIKKANNQTEKFIKEALKQIKKTNEKFYTLPDSGIVRYIDSVRANGGFR